MLDLPELHDRATFRLAAKAYSAFSAGNCDFSQGYLFDDLLAFLFFPVA